MPVISVLNTKGGVGKTTTAMFLANEFSLSGRDVVVLDLDAQGNASSWADKAAERGKPVPFTVEVTNKGRLARFAAQASQGRVVIIDTPPGDSSIIDATIEVSDFVIIPTQPSELDVERVWETLPSVKEGQLHAVLITAAILNTTLLDDLTTVFADNNVSRFTTVIPHRQAYRKAVGYRPPHDAAYADVMKEIEEAQ